MISCPTATDLASHHAGEGDADMRTRIAAHLEGCSACRHAVEQIEMPTQVLRVTPADSVSPPVIETPPPENAVHDEDLRFPGPITADAPLGQLLGYGIVRKLGWGGGGLVYLARDARLRREAALKFLRQDFVAAPRERARFEREARTLASVRHENIVAVHDICFPEFFPPFLVLEYVGGDTLAQRLERDGPWPAAKAARLVRDLAQALVLAHEKDLVHRDVKPANILFDQADVPKLIDFGLARSVGEAGELTQAGVVLGTPAYMSPEQVVAPERVDGRSDVYSLGIVLYEMLTGHVPFRGVPHMILAQIERDDPLPPRRFNDAIPRDLETIVLKALQKEPGKRYASALRLAEDLDRWLRGVPIVARPLGPVRRATRWVTRHPGPSGLAVLLAGFLALWIMGQRQSYQELKQAHAQTQQAQGLAQAQRDVALDTLLDLVFETQDQLQEDTGHETLRFALLHKALDGLRKITRTAQNADLIDLGTATAHLRLGDVHLAMQQPKDALGEFAAAQLLAERIEQREPANLQAQRALLVALYRQGDVEQARGNPQTAAVYFEKAKRHGLALRSRHVQADWLHHGLALVYERLGNCALESDAPSEAIAHFMAAVRAWEAAPPEAPASAAWVKLRLAQAYQRLDDAPRASEWARRGRDEIVGGARRRPEDRAAQRDWASAEALWADVQLQHAKLAEARTSLETADRLLADLLSARPNAAALRRERARVRAQLGRLFERADQLGPARLHLLASWQTWNELAQRPFASVADWKELLLVEKSLIALEAGANAKDEARAWLQKAQRHVEAARQQFVEQHSVKLWMDTQTGDLEAIRRKFGL